MFFFPHVSRAQRLAPEPGSSDSEPSTLTTGLLNKAWRWRARGTVDHAC